MLTVGGLAWWLQLQPTRVVDASSLAALPSAIGPWQSHDIPIEETVESALRADASLQRAYLHSTGELVWVYVGYYGTERGGRPEHNPRSCYASQGWAVLEHGTLSSPDGALRKNEYVVERDGHRRLVHFWYRSHRRGGMLGGFDQNVDRLLGRLFDSRADGALVRISTPMRDRDPSLARLRLLSLGPELDAQLAAHWPIEHRQD